MKVLKSILLFIILSLITANCYALDVIPGLKGFGTTTRAAYGAANSPEICIVTSTAETTGNPAWDTTTYNVDVFTGTFAQCLEGLDTLNGETIDGHVVSANSGKVIIFGTSGTIANTGANDIYRLDQPYTTIAGQTAPSPGITLRNIKFQVAASHVLVQHIRSAAGDELDGETPSTKNSVMASYSLSPLGNASNIVIDHISAIFGIDTDLTVYGSSSYNLSNVTVSNCLIAEGLHESTHSSGAHSMGLALQTNTTNISAINNLMVSNNGRNPYVRWGSKVLVNNYSYNHGIVATGIELTQGSLDLAAVGNITESGPDSADSGMGPYYANLANSSTYSAYWDASNLYFFDNAWIEKDGTTHTQSDASDWSIIRNQYSDDVTPYKVTVAAPLWPTDLTAMDSSLVKAYVIANSGSRPADRDPVDARIIGDVSNDTGDTIDTVELTSADCTAVDDPMWCCTGSGTSTCDRNDEAGFPAIAENTTTFSDLPATPHDDDDSDGYTNLEEWLHAYASNVESADTTAPTTVSSGPSGSLSFGATKIITHVIDEPGTCKYDAADTTYDLMGNTMDGAGTTEHYKSVAVVEGANTFYSRCQDTTGNKQAASTTITFTVQNEDPPSSPTPTAVGVGVSGNFSTQ